MSNLGLRKIRYPVHSNNNNQSQLLSTYCVPGPHDNTLETVSNLFLTDL